MWRVWRERVRLEVGVVIGLFLIGRDLGDLRVVRLGRRHGRLREGWVNIREQSLVIVIFFGPLKNLVPKSNCLGFLRSVDKGEGV